MSKVAIQVPDVGTVFIQKKRGQRTLRLRVDHYGAVQVSMPWIMPRKHALDFIRSKRDWITEQQADRTFNPYNGMLFGKTLRLVLEENSTRSRTSQKGKDVIVPFTHEFVENNPDHIEKIQSAITKAMRFEAEKLLLPRLQEFAEVYGFQYKSSAVKRLSGRWGSCDSNAHIVLNLYLVQLPIELIDYVLFHELAHTKHMNHSPAFWAEVLRVCPDYKAIRKQMRGLQPRIYDAKTFMA
jgi:predicted metal-dependent hydrolase